MSLHKLHLKNYKSISLPAIENPFINELINKKKDKAKVALAKKFAKNGYLKIRVISDLEAENINTDIINKLDIGNFKKNPEIFHYNKSPRIVEGWKFSQNIKNLSLNKKILDLLKFFYEKKPLPFSTINFVKGTEQPMHSDYFHFATKPDLFLVGVWVALENVNKYNGALSVVPGSHKLPIIDFEYLNFTLPTSMKDLKKKYSFYEEYVNNLYQKAGLKKKIINMKKGEALIWAANLLHGGSKILNKNKTRFSQVTHYHFSGCEKYFNPCYSEPSKGIYQLRDINSLLIK